MNNYFIGMIERSNPENQMHVCKPDLHLKIFFETWTLCAKVTAITTIINKTLFVNDIGLSDIS